MVAALKLALCAIEKGDFPLWDVTDHGTLVFA